MKCILSEDINTCPFYDSETMKCNNEDNCSFQEDITTYGEEQYTRKERWYEKYYKDSRPVK